jgi:hypothetical protein
VTISKGSDGWLFAKPDGQTCQPRLSDENLARHLDFARRRAEQQAAQRDQLAAWTASTIPTPQRSVPAGEANPSTCTPASKPSSPSNFPSRTTTKINKPPKPSAFDRRGRDGQHKIELDNTTTGSDNISDNT